jgi:hypothetical protein
MWEKLKSQFNVYVIAGFALLLVVIWVQWEVLKHARLDAAAKDAKISTLSQDFTEYKKASVESAAMFKSQLEAQKAAYDRFGTDVLARMKAQDGQLQVIHDAVGRVNSSVGDVDQKIASLPNGSYADTLTQVRPNGTGGTLPALTAFKFNFNPATKDLKGQWLNNEEEFDFSLGAWKLGKGGYSSAVTGKRFIYKDVDGKRVLVGEEPIPFKSGVATFSEQAFVPDNTVLSVPRLTLFLGAGKDMSTQTPNKWVLAGGLDYRFSNKIGAGINFIGTNSAIVGSYRFGK